ncbi:hypothetical protein FGIG_07919 [Fasciola gigantica]|uniref:DNA mismatch repair protein MutS core domain-containing protein n=1 Tax=Fasciola gigantica TaxID=46835 RepID=A0A504ZA77_FASGI|nr:hypothetical protein FGIG_07919 [Fasciola gigantica]
MSRGESSCCELDNEDEEYRNEVIISFYTSNGCVGVVLYDRMSCVLYFVPEFLLTQKLEWVYKILMSVHPTVLVLSETTMNSMQINAGMLKTVTDAEVSILPQKFFSVCNFFTQLSLLSIPFVPKTNSEMERNHFIESLFPPSHTQLFRAIGGLFSYIKEKDTNNSWGLFSSSLHIFDIRMLKIDSSVYVDSVCLKNLNIFNQNANVQKQLRYHHYSKDQDRALTLYKVFNNCCCRCGRFTLESWMRTPLRDIEKINERLDAVQFLVQCNSSQLLQNMRSYLRLISNLPRILCRMQQSSALPSYWKSILQTLNAIEKLIYLCLPHSAELYPVRNLLNERAQLDLLRKVQTWIMCIVDVEATSKQNRFSVRPGTDSTLDEWKQTYRCLPELLSQLAEEELKKLRENISTCGLIYFPLVGYLLKIPKAEVTTPDIDLSNLEFAFTDSDMAYYRNETTRELDKRYGDVMYSIIGKRFLVKILRNDILLLFAYRLFVTITMMNFSAAGMGEVKTMCS